MKETTPPKDPKKKLWIGYAVIIAILFACNLFLFPAMMQAKVKSVNYSTFLQMLENKQLSTVQIEDQQIYFVDNENNSYKTNAIAQDNNLVTRLEDAGVEFGTVYQSPTIWDSLLNLAISLLPMILLFWWLNRYIGKKMQSMGGANSMLFGGGKSGAKQYVVDDKTGIKFNDVAGEDEAKESLQEIVDFLNNPQKYEDIGAKMPKGVLLVGPPGTGKTLLARAVAGEAGVPFFSIAGSEFVEMFVGMGASKVRDLFKQAGEKAPCIVFIDEIDTIGKKRDGGSNLGGNDEREQTLNQLLVEMDGFDEKTGIILIAATNRADVLDPALLRPGRFDRHVVVDTPDVKGREAILKVHAKDKKFAPDVDFEVLAKRTPGFVGADLANVINEAALLAARGGKTEIGMAELEEGIDRSIAGPERKSRLIGPREKKIIAYHETGHAMVAKLIPGCDPVHKISIIPRGSAALGYTLQLPAEDRFLASKNELTNNICVLLGGRVTEELVFGDITTGASNDLERATQVARSMVTQYGMSSLGPVVLGRQRHEVFLGRDLGEDRNYSDQIAFAIDEEVRKIVEECYVRVKKLLSDNRDKVDLVAETLLEREVMDGHDLAVLLGEEEPVSEKSEEKAASESAGAPAPEEPAPAEGKAADGFIPRAPVVSNEMAPMERKEPPSAKGE